MAQISVIIIVLGVLLTAKLTACLQTVMCEYYNDGECKKGVGQCNGTLHCPEPEEADKRTHCYAYWSNVTGVVEIKMKGCWLDLPRCYDRLQCVDDKPLKQNHFCCCEGDLCNSNVYAAESNSDSGLQMDLYTSAGPWPERGDPEKSAITYVIMVTIVPLVSVAVIIIVVFWLWHRRSHRLLESIDSPSLLHGTADHTRGPLCYTDLTLVELKARGCSSCVWKAKLDISGSFVAVKVFPEHEWQSWRTECDFYSQPMVASHANILRFIGADSHGPGHRLITEYHELGSVCDYLRVRTISLTELIIMAKSLSCGLAFLHSSVGSKPPIAHRDIKSPNVLLRNNMSVCIADFGLAMTLGGYPGDVHAQVGTRRYMAPEVLDGSINFSIEYFLKIDVYACALVLWEMLSRCSTVQDNISSYLMPFEDIVGQHPTLEDMQEAVVSNKLRPALKPSWHQHGVLSVLCSTIDESWDQDPEARLSAECIDVRLGIVEETLLSTQLCGKQKLDGQENDDMQPSEFNNETVAADKVPELTSSVNEDCMKVDVSSLSSSLEIADQRSQKSDVSTACGSTSAS